MIKVGSVLIIALKLILCHVFDIQWRAVRVTSSHTRRHPLASATGKLALVQLTVMAEPPYLLRCWYWLVYVASSWCYLPSLDVPADKQSVYISIFLLGQCIFGYDMRQSTQTLRY